MKPDPYLRIPPRPPRLPRDHRAMRPKLSENAKAFWFLAVIAVLVGIYAYLHHPHV